ncbi:DUF421 domain-containing protein [Jeotgalibaca caeni]|uniref:DUF421 domain-containing protein n=1 Tax=Jeotgalibaca caeni TaxID=3028623 RepID=UPI00237D3438|nr:YetF domain-containing protein [Jeotgalibaca caeni]MDE1549647.1 DUF421 domain-containing protein [Jeotgalibaca caeni]
MYIGILSKLFIGFFGTIIVMRAVGKKALSEITPYDIIYTIILGGIVQEGLYDDKVHVGHIVFALFIWGVVIYLVETLVQRRDNVARKMKGEPSVFIYKGELNLYEIHQNHIEMEQLRSILREQNCFSLSQVEYAVMETNGIVSIIKNPDSPDAFTYLLVDDGVPEINTLQTIGKDEKWLYDQLGELGYTDIKELVYVEWSEENQFLVKTYAECYNQHVAVDG